MEEELIYIKIVTVLLLYNAFTLLKMMEIYVQNSNKLKIQPRCWAGVAELVRALYSLELYTILKVEGSNPAASFIFRVEIFKKKGSVE